MKISLLLAASHVYYSINTRYFFSIKVKLETSLSVFLPIGQKVCSPQRRLVCIYTYTFISDVKAMDINT